MKDSALLEILILILILISKSCSTENNSKKAATRNALEYSQRPTLKLIKIQYFGFLSCNHRM
jgi:hypothetical protein